MNTFAYDALNRLQTTSTFGGQTITYTYTASGQVQTVQDTRGSMSYSYDALDQLLCTTTGTDCAAGVITSYDYDGRGNLVEESTSGLVTRYIYDAGGRRISEDVNGTVTHYRWDEFSPYGDIVVETDGSGAVTASYVLGSGKLIAQTRDGVTGYYLPDAQGSIRALTDASGAVIEAYDYAAFGDLLQDIPDPLSSYLYAGQRYDATIEQYTLRAREYDPVFSTSHSPARVAPSAQIAAQSACLRWSTLFARLRLLLTLAFVRSQSPFSL